MFTGIISNTTKVIDSINKNGSLFLTFEKPKNWNDLKPGDSVATNGVCLTVKTLSEQDYTTELMKETLEKTTFGKTVPKAVNLERPVGSGKLLDGHIVQGHVDGVGVIEKTEDIETSKLIKLSFDRSNNNLVVNKGSITVDGISLTVVEAGDGWFTVSLVDYTIRHTTLGGKKQGELVNLEFDIIGKYVAKQLGKI